MRRRDRAGTGWRISDKNAKPILRALEEAARGRASTNDPIVEQLKQCPEAFKAGEILGKAFDSLKYRQEDAIDGDRLWPPPGTILPPFA